MKVVLVLALAAALYQLAVVLIVRLAWRTPRGAPRRDPSRLGIPFETVRFPTLRGKSLHGWWMPSGVEHAPCVVLVHGWGRSVERMLPWIELLRPGGFDLLAFDAREHGLSDPDGFASMVKFSEDIRGAVSYARESRGALDGGGIGVLGLSTGGSAAIHAAAHDPRITAVATVGAFAVPSARVLLGKRWWLLAPGVPLAFRLAERRVGFRFHEEAPQRLVGRSRARFLFIHGADDAVIPVANARQLAEAAGPKAEAWIIPGRGHSDPNREPEMAARLTTFFGRAP